MQGRRTGRRGGRTGRSGRDNTASRSGFDDSTSEGIRPSGRKLGVVLLIVLEEPQPLSLGNGGVTRKER